MAHWISNTGRAWKKYGATLPPAMLRAAVRLRRTLPSRAGGYWQSSAVRRTFPRDRMLDWRDVGLLFPNGRCVGCRFPMGGSGDCRFWIGVTWACCFPMAGAWVVVSQWQVRGLSFPNGRCVGCRFPTAGSCDCRIRCIHGLCPSMARVTGCLVVLTWNPGYRLRPPPRRNQCGTPARRSTWYGSA